MAMNRNPDNGPPPTLAHNVVHFVRVLRGAGLPMSPAQAVDAIAALQWIDLEPPR